MEVEKDHPQRVFGLDAMRAAAILLVLTAHVWPPRMTRANWGFTFGVLGVEMFFILSGFLIGGILLRLALAGRFRTEADLMEFWRRRWYRILPNYYLFLLLRMAWDYWVEGNPNPLLNYYQYFVFLQNFTHSAQAFFGESWSLTIEEWFYLLFPFLLWVMLRAMKQKEKACVLAILIFFTVPLVLRVVAAIRMNHYCTNNWDLTFRRPVVFRLDVLMYGVAAAFIAIRRPVLWNRLIRFWWLGLVLIAVATASLAYYWPLNIMRKWEGMVLWPCMAIGFTLILARASLVGEVKGWLAKSVSFVAAISYALYLSHLLAFHLVDVLFGPKSFLFLRGWTGSWTLVALIFAFLFSTVVHYAYERPMMNLRDRSRDKQAGATPRSESGTPLTSG